METYSRIIFGNSNKMDSIDLESVDLIVTSPPYPMIKMWDEMFCDQNPSIEDALKRSHGMKAFELMHKELDSENQTKTVFHSEKKRKPIPSLSYFQNN